MFSTQETALYFSWNTRKYIILIYFVIFKITKLTYSNNKLVPFKTQKIKKSKLNNKRPSVLKILLTFKAAVLSKQDLSLRFFYIAILAICIKKTSTNSSEGATNSSLFFAYYKQNHYYKVSRLMNYWIQRIWKA